MNLQFEEADLSKFIMVGDRVLIKPKSQQEKTKSGLYLPPGIQEKEKIASGYVLKVGPGYPIPSVNEDEPWMGSKDDVKYVPLQPHEGDLAVYLQNSGYELEFSGEKLIIISSASILMLFRDDEMFS